MRTAAQATAESLEAEGGGSLPDGAGLEDMEVVEDVEGAAHAGGEAGGEAGTASDCSPVLGLRLEEGGVLAVLRAHSLQLFSRGEGGERGKRGGSGDGARSAAADADADADGAAAAVSPEASARSAALQKALAQLEAEEDW